MPRIVEQATVVNLAICITLYRRPAYTLEVLNSLLECYGIEGIPVYLSHDWNHDFNASCEEVHQIASEFQRKYPGPSQYYVHSERKGIDLNKLFVIPLAFQLFPEKQDDDFVVLIEDDTVPSRDFIRYMQAMSTRYFHDNEVWSVTGYNNISEQEFNDAFPYAIGRARGFNPWGWGTWRSRWMEFYGDGGEQYKRDAGANANGLFDHWLSKKERALIAPLVPRTKLIGQYNAEHTTPPDWEKEENMFGIWLYPNQPDITEPWPDVDAPMGTIHCGTEQIENK